MKLTKGTKPTDLDLTPFKNNRTPFTIKTQGGYTEILTEDQDLINYIKTKGFKQ